MRYDEGQKPRTHERIVAEAARLFRARGYAGCGVDAVMKSAGLTAGGFYAHFKNKDALLAEALESAVGASARKLVETAATAGSPAPDEGGGGALRWAARYLSERHRDDPGAGCVLPTLAGEVPRQPKAVRAAFTRGVRGYLAELARLMPGRTPAERDHQAIATLSSLAGAMLLARAVDDPAFSGRILSSVRETLRDGLARRRRKRKRTTRAKA